MSQRTQPWTEKYRPKTVDEVVHQEEVVNALKNSLETGNLPHLLFYGPPGTGKTSTILAIAKQLFGPEMYQHRVLELNASDERGINVIRTKVKTFAQLAVSSSGSNSNYPCPPFKLIILDEADSMTVDAQSALRRTMETYSSVTRFCLICNYVSRIIDPITSRCAKFRFKPLERTLLKDRLSYIADKEGVTIENDNVLDLIFNICDGGDLRRAITTLQSAVRMYGKNITEKHIIEISGMVPNSLIIDSLENVINNDVTHIKQTVDDLILNGYAAYQIIIQLSTYLLSEEEKKLSDLQKSKILLKIGECDKCLIDGADEFLQLFSLFSSIKQICSIDEEGDVNMK
ncbi:hypothetical protein ABK040_002030 [Willaertia magna]